MLVERTSALWYKARQAQSTGRWHVVPLVNEDFSIADFATVGQAVDYIDAINKAFELYRDGGFTAGDPQTQD